MFIFFELGNFAVDLQRMIYLDYLLVHSGDFTDDLESLYPPSPFRASELAIKRELLKKSLQILHKKSLVEVILSKTGILYAVTNSGKEFVEIQNSDYSQKLRIRVKWLVTKTSPMSDDELAIFVSSNSKKWASEFIRKQ